MSAFGWVGIPVTTPLESVWVRKVVKEFSGVEKVVAAVPVAGDCVAVGVELVVV